MCRSLSVIVIAFLFAAFIRLRLRCDIKAILVLRVVVRGLIRCVRVSDDGSFAG